MTCEQLPTERLQKICRGESELPIWKANVYRAQFGVDPLPDTGETTPVMHDGAAELPLRPHSPQRQGVFKPLTGGCKSCGPDSKPKSLPPTGPGTELTAIMATMGLPHCQACKDLSAKMDSWGVAGCRDRVAEIVDDIMPRAIDWVAESRPWVSAMFPVVKDFEIRRRVKSYVTQAIDLAERKQTLRERVFRGESISRIQTRPISWPDSPEPIVTIIPAIRTAYRKTETLTATIASMASAGFQQPLTFAEPDTPEDVTTDVRFETQLKPFRSFVTMCEWLLNNRTDQWFLLCEDDLRFTAGAADLIRTYPLGKSDVLSLYVSKAQERQLGFSAIVGDLHGSLAYLIHRGMIRSLLDSVTFTTWAKKDRVDRAFSQAVQEVGGQLIIHTPSLVQHTGETSTISVRRKLTHARTSTVAESRHESPTLTLVTPTGDRPEAFALCERWMQNQRYTGAFQWIVVDDGRRPTACTMGQQYIRREPSNGHTLCANLREVMPLVSSDLLLIIEDDEYYGPDYLSTMVGQLEHAELVGERASKYYFPAERKWHQYPDWHHVALCRMGFRSSVFPTIIDAIAGTDDRSVDLRIWNTWTGSRRVWVDHRGDMRLSVGIKGMPGRPCGVGRAPAKAIADPNAVKLRQLLGEDTSHYLGMYQPPLPGLAKQTAGLVTTAAKYVASGMENATAEVQQSRLKICESCDLFRSEDRRCSDCGCFVDTKTAIAVSECPQKKW